MPIPCIALHGIPSGPVVSSAPPVAPLAAVSDDGLYTAVARSRWLLLSSARLRLSLCDRLASRQSLAS